MSDLGKGGTQGTGTILLIAPCVCNEREKAFLKPVSAVIRNGIWRSTDSELQKALSGLRLSPGHHADRDLELARMAAKLLGGKVKDSRPSPQLLHKLPR